MVGSAWWALWRYWTGACFFSRGRGDNGHEFSNMGYGECHGEFTYSYINIFNLQIANRVSDHGYTGYLRAVGKTNQRPTGLIQTLSIVATRMKIGHCFQWPFQGPKLEVPTIYLCKGISPAKYGLIWYSTSILGSWNSHWLYFYTFFIYQVPPLISWVLGATTLLVIDFIKVPFASISWVIFPFFEGLPVVPHKAVAEVSKIGNL